MIHREKSHTGGFYDTLTIEHDKNCANAARVLTVKTNGDSQTE